MSDAERKNGDQDADVAFGIVAYLIVFSLCFLLGIL